MTPPINLLAIARIQQMARLGPFQRCNLIGCLYLRLPCLCSVLVLDPDL